MLFFLLLLVTRQRYAMVCDKRHGASGEVQKAASIVDMTFTTHPHCVVKGELARLCDVGCGFAWM